jgi:coenzyme F420-dependent glucose-6-phosphate dehydrogenase
MELQIPRFARDDSSLGFIAMTLFGYHASHEQHAPSSLLEYVRAAEQAGFQGVMAADHMHPWLEENGQSGFVWSWLGAAMQATSMPFGIVNAPGDRYHPAIVAQGAATLAEMFPGRFWLAVGSGEALNEHVTGRRWPPKSERNARLRECVDVIRALWRGETVTHRGRVIVEDARLYTRPATPPRLLGAAVSEQTAAWVAGWADGLITTGRPRDAMERLIDVFRRGGGDGKPIVVQHTLSWAPREDDALRAAHEQWRFCVLDSERLWSLRTPRDFSTATRAVSPEQVAAKIRVSSDLDAHAGWLADYASIGVDEVYLFNVGSNQREFIDAFGRAVLPGLASHSE